MYICMYLCNLYICVCVFVRINLSDWACKYAYAVQTVQYVVGMSSI